MSHSVEHHLGLSVSDYDTLIRRWIPGYEAMLDEVLAWLGAMQTKPTRILDLGAGTGALSEAVLARFPEAVVELWDIDSKMLAQARGRLARFGARAVLVERSFAGALSRCDAVVASLSLHHVPTMGAKREVYANILAALRPGGQFVCADAVVAGDGLLRDQAFDRWAAFMRTNGVPEVEARRLFADWSREDFYQPLPDELRALTEVGFDADCFWRQGPMAVYGGSRA